MNALSWVCRRIWGFAILAAFAGGWFYGWRAGLPLGLLAYGVVYCATFCGATFTVSPHPLSVRPVRRDYTAQRLEIQVEENATAYVRALADAEAGLTHELLSVRMLSADNLRTLRGMTPAEYAARRIHAP
jgi:hypothetical protein